MQITYQAEEFKSRIEEALSLSKELDKQATSKYEQDLKSYHDLVSEVIEFLDKKFQEGIPLIERRIEAIRVDNETPERTTAVNWWGREITIEKPKRWLASYDNGEFRSFVYGFIQRHLNEHFQGRCVFTLQTEDAFFRGTPLRYHGEFYYDCSEVFKLLNLEHIKTDITVQGLTAPSKNELFLNMAHCFEECLFQLRGSQQTVVLDSKEKVWEYLLYIEKHQEEK